MKTILLTTKILKTNPLSIQHDEMYDMKDWEIDNRLYLPNGKKNFRTEVFKDDFKVLFIHILTIENKNNTYIYQHLDEEVVNYLEL